MKKILIIDDEEDFCYFVKKNLEATGDFEVVTCSDSTNVIKQIKTLHPDLVLIDMVMPGVDGPSIAAEIRDDNEIQNIPYIFLTAIIKKEEAKNLIGGEYFIAKPVKISELINVINKLTI